MAMSENSVKVLNFLKENHDKSYTSGDIADALGLPKATINGVFTGLQKKHLGARVDAEVPGVVDVVFLSLTDEGRALDTSNMGETIQKIVTYMSNATDHITLDDLAEALNMKKNSVNGSFNSLVKKGYAARTPAKVQGTVQTKFLVLTDEGMAFDADSEVAE